MIGEMAALESNRTWTIIPLPLEMPYKHRLKVRMAAKGYSKVYGLHYYDTFSPAEYCAMTHTTMELVCDNQTIASFFKPHLFMRGLNTEKLIVTLSERRSFRTSLKHLQ